MNNLLLQRFINNLKLIAVTEQHTLLLAVSGGLDSVVLCHLCKLAGYSFAIAHCNFGLRGEESNKDEAFVKALAAQLEVPFYVNNFNTKAFAAEHKLSIQVAARELRYQWFHEIVNGQLSVINEKASSYSTHLPSITTHYSPLTFIATAHHLDDNIETLLMNLFKGTGISGLHGIQPKSGKIVRPLLFAKREEIKDFATEHNLLWVEDSSNAEIKYTRNYIRHKIIPSIESIFPTVKENIADSIERLREAEILYEQAMQVHKKKLLEFKGQEVYIPVLKLERTSPLATIIYEIIKDYGFSSQQVPEVIKLLRSESGRYVTSASHRILHNRDWLIITPLPQVQDTVLIIEEATTQLAFTEGTLLFKTLPAESITIEADAAVALLDKEEMQFPLILRKWKEGDYFYPLGMRKKKKLARFFIDQKLSQLQKEKVWVLESNKRIVWVVGRRIDDRFKIKPSTKEVVRIELKPV
ncbi:tRNA lysidine(34) synthetase TilS [Flavisolibacter tropicus]|uniref:tRNA(Ile)-lysidine synthase n=1 Tax=Flavisolibacter tropicus TaxID=1492898 RepID=A0A172TRY4_9BACT|nr:tRNA lysidine(34) synthetase TilS [Flavisolibacter tropicus]ANE49752.1 tRNA(Ile)-lysidine synthase [Flavisolibacter tropicus]